MIYKSFIKTIMDISIAGIILILFSPIIILVIAMLLIFQKGKVFFIQDRPGKNEKAFKLIKFKTMTDDRDQQGNLLPDEKRLTWIGKFIRKTSLDEIPQLVNVVKSEMSLVGPRPLLSEYLSLYNEAQIKRHLVKPGITGWAQVNGRNNITWEDKFEYDVWYVDHQSLLLDLKIIFLTLMKVIKAEGISGEGVATMKSSEK